MAPSRRKGSARAAAAAAASRQWKIGDLVLAKMKGFPAWPAVISEPEKWGFSSDRKKILVFFYGTKQIAFCNHVDIEAFTEEKKKTLLVKRQGKGADFVRAVDEIIDTYENLKEQDLGKDSINDDNDVNLSTKKNVEAAFCSSPDRLSNALVTGCCDKVSVLVSAEKFAGTVLEGGDNTKNVAVAGSAEEISILDKLRQTSLSNITTTRKRARDSNLQGSVTKSTPSLRRSRSSSSNKPNKSRTASEQADIEHDVGCLVQDTVHEESLPREQTVESVIATCTADPTCISVRILSNSSIQEILAVKSESTNLDDVTALESGGGPEHSNDTCMNACCSEKDVISDGKFDIPLMTLLSKNCGNSKQETITEAYSELNRLSDFQINDGRSVSDSSNSRNGIDEKKLNKADGDKHLPLVKRARVRMGKPLVEDKLDDSVCSRLNSSNTVCANKLGESPACSSPAIGCPQQSSPPRRISTAVKEVSSSSTNDCPRSSTCFDSPCDANKYQLKLDVEAALPPSKRLHRALEAMSANAAEAENDSGVLGATEAKVNNCLGSPKDIACGLIADKSARCAIKPLPTHSSDSSLLHSSASGSSSTITLQNLAITSLTLSEAKPKCSHSGSIKSPPKGNMKEVLEGMSGFDGSYAAKNSMNAEACSSVSLNNHSTECGPGQSSIVMEKNDEPQLVKVCTNAEGCSTRQDGDSKAVSPMTSGSSNFGQHDGLSKSDGTAKAQLDANSVFSENNMNGATVVSSFMSVSSLASGTDGVPPVSSGTNVSASDTQGTASVSLTTNVYPTTSDISRATMSSWSQSEETSQVKDMQDITVEIKQKLTPKNRSISASLAPIKDLIAAAQAKRFFSRSTSFSDNHTDGKNTPDAVTSPSLINKEVCLGRVSPSDHMFYQIPASDHETCYLQNGNRTPNGVPSDKGFNKFMDHAEINAARRSFKALLCTLSRTKESIGRATRVAIDCAKYGIAGEVVDILVQYLEKESSLHRRVDLFFLVDSITQCSRCQRGGAGDVYPSLVQAVLPRLLSAAAPPGNAATENRRQCLKVLRLWLERRILPDFTVRHHIRELEYGTEASFSNSYSRRHPRTERAVNDPLREMEGMLVDEYGSNASFQLPDNLSTRILEDDEGSASEEKGFEAVTPDRNVQVDHDGKTARTPSEKHRHLLEDVDGELEMEDVAPLCGEEASQSTSHTPEAGVVYNYRNQFYQNKSVLYVPPLPDNRPPSPPPLPSSPPPVPPYGSTARGLAPHNLAGSSAVCNNTDSQSRADQTAKMQLPQPVSHPGFGGHTQQLPPAVSSSTSSGSLNNLPVSRPAMPTGCNSQQPSVNMPSTSKVYHVQPPPPMVSNQFSYLQAQQPQQRPQPWVNHSSFADGFHHANDIPRGSFYSERVPRGSIPLHDVSDRNALYPAPMRSEKVEPPYVPPYFGAQPDSSSATCQGWCHPPRTSSFAAPPRAPLENPVSRVAGAPSYWRAR
ncbi:HUA2-like protein 2 [Apostasia shenzhenica]|uniref:HUA2-like protein 2 n=1 Tax=Apostasia shenzhenica TaxID=1088818 RepID=A0A2I0BGC8_9ASPA|nr:HUA2-like protein 2 [Apostasia shenzhenica]